MKPVDLLFPEMAKLKASGLCPTCQKPIGAFRDTISKKEFAISGMCQECQDSVFGAEKF